MVSYQAENKKDKLQNLWRFKNLIFVLFGLKMSEKINLRKRKQPLVPTKQLEDEETTDEEEEVAPARKRAKRGSKSKSTTRESSVQPSGSGDESDDEKSTPEPVELMVPNRARRSTAGNKMATLLSSAVASDDFYDSAYGGFVEDDVDKNFTSPENSDADDVDSDFDRNEGDQEDEPDSGAEEDDSNRDRKRNKLLSKNKKWVVARFDKFTVKENSCDAKTQQQRLLEAKKTALENTESLKRFEEVEIERKKRQMKPTQKKVAAGPRIISISTAKMSGHGFVSQYLTVPEVKVFEKPKQKVHLVCAVTGLEAKYIDPLTELPYANLDAFKKIRQSYEELLQSLDNTEDEAMDGLDAYKVSLPMEQT
uniref:Vacuolar protein sorting-associated protein 72 homolog n=1 Tax=Ditylenchus dipsaci TaxID=166011 RepID=A0A915EE31_9BILA